MIDADPKTYVACFPVAQYHESVTSPVLKAEIEKKLLTWNDPPAARSWTRPDPSLTGKIEAAKGMLTERFGFCQTMPLDDFLSVAEALRPTGFRPLRFRPYEEGHAVKVAVVWTRDGVPWRIANDQSAEEVLKTDEQNRTEEFLSVDAIGYVVTSPDGKPISRFAALWVQKAGPDDARIVLASSAAELKKVKEELKSAGFTPAVLHTWRQPGDQTGYSGVWRKPSTGSSGTGSVQTALSEASLPATIAGQAGSLMDIGLTATTPPLTTKERATTALQAAETALKAKPGDLDARFARASALVQLGEHQKSLEDLDAVIEKSPLIPLAAYQYRAIAYAHLGYKEGSKADLERFQKRTFNESQKLHLAVIVAAELGEGLDEALKTLEAALQRQPQNSALHYDAACAYALASKALNGKDKAKSKGLSERAILLLGKSIENGYSDYPHMQEDSDLDPLREIPAFAEIMQASHLVRQYSNMRIGDYQFEAVPLFGNPTAHLQRSRKLVSQGYRIVTLSVARTASDRSPITASVWHRPVMSDEAKDRLAERQARAAIALLRMGKATELMPLLTHSPDPRLRSFIVNWLNPLGVEPAILSTELDRLPATAQPTPSQGQQVMEAVLFHPETSQRRALILALGTYGKEGMSSGEREPLTTKLLDLYRNDPDCGIHGATAWTLRRWGLEKKLTAIDSELMKLKERGDRRWYVNSQGQTFAVVEGPVEFRMGSPPTEPDRNQNEIPHTWRIERRFAIAATEVSFEQYQQFMKANPGVAVLSTDKSSPDPNGPMNHVSWYGAAAYCNWLSRQEGLLECYEPNPQGKYAAGMKIKPDALRLGGYRLPTEGEWEYACRAGAQTSRYYGASLDLLGRYAWHNITSRDHAWRCGSLLPNELGLSDMLGNVCEWCQEVFGSVTEQETASNALVHDDDRRILRGGTFSHPAADVRSAIRVWYTPEYRFTLFGFRPSKTVP